MQRIAHLPCMHARHTAQLSFTRTQWQNFGLIKKFVEKDAPKGAASSAAIAAMFLWNPENIFQTRYMNPGRECTQVEANFSLNQEIHQKDVPKGTGHSAAIAARF